MTQQEKTPSPVTKVLRRLETYIDPETRKIKQRVEIISSLIDSVTADQLIISLNKSKISGVEKEREEFENIGIAYLLKNLQQRLETQQQKFEIRREQIEAIVALLQKNHLQAATGFGKSSVIIPIAAVIGALSENGNYAVVSVSPELKEELFNKISNIASFLPEKIRPLLLTYKKSDSEEKPTDSPLSQSSQEERFKQMAKALIENSSSLQENINQQQRTSYFEQLLSGQPPPFQTETQKTLPSLPKNNPSITLFEENDYVFYTMTDQESPLAHTIFDEIHVPRSRNTVYYKSSQPPFVSPQAVETYLFKRFLAHYLKNILNQVPIKEEKGSFWFQDEAAENTFFEKEVFNDPNNKEFFDEAVAFIAQKTELDKEKLKQWLMGFSFKNYEDYEDVVSEILLSLMRAKMIREGVHYQQRESQHIVRDRFMGIALPSHRFSFDIQLGLQAWQEVVSFADYFENAAETVSFEGWVTHYLHGKISGLSGTLFTPTLTDQHPRKTSLAHFLEKQTGHKAILIGGEKWIAPPEPQILQNDLFLQKALFQQLQDDDRQTIVFCYDENEAKNLQDVLSEKFPQRPIILADASIAEEEAKKRYHEFANNKNAILISTGRTGVGVDIKDSQGKHTDHKSIIYGLPWSIDQIYQALGRRRMKSQNPKKDFVWLISLDQVQKYDGYLSLENEERTKILKDLNKKPMKVIERLIKINEQSHRASDDFLVDFDRLYQSALSLYQEKVQQNAKKVSENILNNLKLAEGERTLLIEQFFKQIFNQSLSSYFTNFVAAPSSLYWHLREAFSYLINPSSLGAEVIGILQSVVSEDNVNDWVAAKAADFEYFLSQIILPQIRQIPNYNLLLKSKPESIRFMVGGFMPVELSELSLEEADLEELKNKLGVLSPGLNKITLPSSQTIYVYIDQNRRSFFLFNSSKELITTTSEEIISTVFSSQKGPQILVIFK